MIPLNINIQRQMNLCRYDKLNALIHLQNQKAHYRKIFEAKKNIDFSEHRPDTSHLKNPKKFDKERRREIQHNNSKLIKKIQQINDGKGLLENMKSQAQQHPRPMRTQSQFHSNRHHEKEICKENLQYAMRLKQVKPIVGNKNEWVAHHKNFRILQKNIQQHSQRKIYDPENQLRSTLRSLSRRQNIFLPTEKQEKKRGGSLIKKYKKRKINKSKSTMKVNSDLVHYENSEITHILIEPQSQVQLG